MKNKIFSTLALAVLLGGAGFLSSCGDDDVTFADPTIELSENATTASPGEEISVTVTATTDATFESIVVTKLWDGNSQGTLTIDELPEEPFTYTYTVLDEDADHILSFNFLITDSQDKTASVDWVVTVELTPMQLLVKYDWNLSDEIRQKTSASDIADVYKDDVYRFNTDGTYAKSNGGTADDFNDGWYNYCFYDLNETTLRLLMSRTGAFGEDEVDTLNITVISDTQILADVTYYDLDQLDATYDPVEEYEKQFSAVAKTESFDPYGTGADDDAGPANMDCIEQTFDN
ncbi:MAG: hypothetical protein RIM99_20255 [Cyclobacteriaceae bacterium]